MIKNSEPMRAGDLEVELAPETGGSLAAFRMSTGEGLADLMRPLSEAARARRDPIGAAMFPMVPYANRIGGNRFTFRGREYRFEANNPPERFNVHGTGWHSVWTETALGPTERLLELRRTVAGEPYEYSSTQRFTLAPDRLTVAMQVANNGPRAMPFGFGEHPWFIRDPDVEVRFRAGAFWLEGPDLEATERIATPPELGFHDWKRLPPKRRNNCYGDWDGVAEVRWPARGVGLRITAEPIFAHLMLYCDPSLPVFCLEPQTNLTSAIDMLADEAEAAALGLYILEPGQSVGGGMAFTPFLLA